MIEVELILTKKEPKEFVAIDEENNKVIPFKEYLYTDTGYASRWSIAMWIAYEEKEKPKEVIKLKLEEVKE